MVRNYKDQVKNEYFNWLYNYVCSGKVNKYITYKKLFALMYDIDFDFYMRRDMNRAIDGMDLRNRFAFEKGKSDNQYEIDELLDNPCSVLEVIIALAIRIEGIMDNPEYGDRTSQWFWGMMSNLGLNLMTDDVYDEDEAVKIIYDFMERRYSPDGKGGLFYVKNCELDMTQIEIWEQLCIYINNFS